MVRAERPTSAKAGDSALVLGDGTIEGFVGGVCAEDSVRLHGLRVLETGEPLLLRLVPDAGEDDGAAVDGAVVSHNPCLSGGALEIFLDPSLPPPRVGIVGDAPVADALRDLAPRLGLEAALVDDGHPVSGADLALVVASHGRAEEAVLAAALRQGVPYVGLVASTRRGEAVRTALDVPDALRSRLHTPAGLAIGARTAPEIALSILAEIVAERRSGGLPAQPREAVAAGPASLAEGAGGCCHHHDG